MQNYVLDLLQENDRLRALEKGDTVMLARSDAMALALRHFAAMPISRRKAHAYGMTHRRWEWAMALLSAARVYSKRGGWAVDDLSLIRNALDRATKTTSMASLTMRRRSQNRRTSLVYGTPGEGCD